LAFDRAGGLHGIESFVYSRLGNLEKLPRQEYPELEGALLETLNEEVGS
jgi:hypothetical protein